MSALLPALLLLGLSAAGQHGPAEETLVPVAEPAASQAREDAQSTPASATALHAPGVEQASSAPAALDAAEGSSLQLTTCLEHLARDRADRAAVCYRERAGAATRPADQDVASALAEVAEEIARQERSGQSRQRSPEREPEQARTPALEEARESGIDLAATLTSGRPGFLLGSIAIGTWMGGALTVTTLQLYLFGPFLLVGATAGLGAGIAALVLLDDMSDGDVALIKSSMVFGILHSILAGEAGYSLFAANSPQAYSGLGGAMLATTALSVAGGTIASRLLDLPAGNVALATNGAFWSGVIAWLLLSVLPPPGDLLPLPDMLQPLVLTFAAADLTYAALLSTSALLEVERLEALTLTAGAATGFVLSFLPVAAVAEEQPMAWSLMALATALGGGAGFVAGRHLRLSTAPRLERMTGLDLSLGPSVIPPSSERALPALAASALLRW